MLLPLAVGERSWYASGTPTFTRDQRAPEPHHKQRAMMKDRSSDSVVRQARVIRNYRQRHGPASIAKAN